MKIILLLVAIMLLVAGGAEARYSPGLEIAEGENITLDGGFIKNFQSDGRFNILAFGATPNDFTDDAQAIQDCYDAAHAVYVATGSFQDVIWPPGEFNGNSTQYPSAPSTIIRVRPGTITQGAGMGATTFRAADNYRNSTRGVYMLWNEDEYCPGMQIRDITFEFGNNTVEAGEITFTVGCGAYWTSDAVVQNVEFKNISGFWGLLLGGKPGKESDCRNAFVDNIHVYNSVGSSVADDSTYDHTSVRINMDNSIFRDSILENEAVPGNAAAFEIHGNNSIVSGLIITNYTNGCNMGADDADEAWGQIVTGCQMTVEHGINVWSVTGSDVIDFTASNNRFNLLSGGSTASSYAIGTAVGGDIRNVTFVDNEVFNYSTEETTTQGVAVTTVQNLVVTGNKFYGMSRAVSVWDTTYIDSYDISENFINKWGYHMTPMTQYTAGIYLDLQLAADGGSLVVNDNVMIGGSGNDFYGILL